MFLFSFFRSTAAAPEVKPAAAAKPKTRLTPESRVIALSNADEDFVDVDLKQLSYAEVAVLAKGKDALKTATIATQLRVVDHVESELGKDVTDVQMAESIAHHALSGDGTAAALMDFGTPLDDLDDDALYATHEKGRLSKKKGKKLNKKGKGHK